MYKIRNGLIENLTISKTLYNLKITTLSSFILFNISNKLAFTYNKLDTIIIAYNKRLISIFFYNKGVIGILLIPSLFSKLKNHAHEIITLTKQIRNVIFHNVIYYRINL